MRVLKVLLICFLFSVSACAGSIDSLQRLIDNCKTDDTTKVNLLASLGEQYKDGNVDSMLFLANKGIGISNKLNFDAGLAKCQTLVGLYFLHKCVYDSALISYQAALKIVEQNKNTAAQVNIVLSIADVYYGQAKYGLALEYYKKGLEISQLVKNLKKQGFANLSIGGIYSDLGNYSEALKFYLEGLKNFEADNYPLGSSMCLSNIATIYSTLGDTKKSLDFINKCLALPISNNEALLSNFTNAGVVYEQMKDFDNAFKYFKKALKLADSLGVKEWHIVSIINNAEVYEKMEKYDEALALYTSVLKDTQVVKETTFYLNCFKGAGRIFVKKGKIKDGIINFEKALGLAKKYQAKQDIANIAEALSNTYEKGGDYKNALVFHKMFADYYDSVYNEKNDRRVQQIQFDYELEKKQNIISNLTKDKIIADQKNLQQRVVVISLLFGMLCLMSVVAIMQRNKRFEKKSKEQLNEQKTAIEEQAQRLEEVVKLKDKVFSILSHDLRGPINNIVTSFALIEQKILTVSEFEEMRPEMTRKLISLSILLDNLLKWASSNIQEKRLSQPENVLVYEIANKNIHLLNYDAKIKNIEISNLIPEGTVALCRAGQIDIVLRNLINNAIKFTKHGGKIAITAENIGKNVRISVIDSGVGMTKEKIDKLFTVNSGKSSYGTDGESGLGIGLLLCYEFMKASNGTIEVSSEVDKGSTFTIVLPS